MKNLLSILGVLVLAGVALAGPGGIAGNVYDAKTGAPLANAVVVARSENGINMKARTDDQGHYEILRLQPAEYHVGAEAAGYQPARYPEAVPVRPDEVMRGINFQLRRDPGAVLGAIVGQVIDRRTREPLPKALVLARGRQGSGKAHTDAHGFYVIKGLPRGEYQVAAKARNYVGEVFPRPVPVKAGEVTRDIGFALAPMARKGAIVGRVVDVRTSEPIPGAMVVAQGPNGAGRAATDRHGYYFLKLNPGLYRVVAKARNYQSEAFPHDVAVRPGQAVKDINFTLHRTTVDAK